MAAPDIIVGLGHRKRVGKNEFGYMLADYLEDRGFNTQILAFAEAMKEMAACIFDGYGLRNAHHYEINPEHKEQPLSVINKTPRQIWIEFGNAMRAIDPDIWVRIVRRAIDGEMLREKLHHVRKPRAFIITDVRFPNEADAIRSWGGHLAVIRRYLAPVSNDPAELALEWYGYWEWTVDNNGTLEHLAKQAENYANFLMTPKRKQQ